MISSHSVAIVVGSHKVWSSELTDAVDKFCETYNAVVYFDHTSNYKGKYGISFALVGAQERFYPYQRPEILIYIGEISGTYEFSLSPLETWRVSPDGEVRDPFGNISYVFEMDELIFFQMYSRSIDNKNISRYNECRAVYNRLFENIPQLPFSNAWIAQQTCHRLPENSVLHLGILNSLRSWSFFELPHNVQGYSNTGGFGIDGCVSTLIGASLANRNKLFFGVVGDLAFFYDLNSLGNRHIKNNIRLMVINNGVGIEMRLYSSPVGASIKDEGAPFLSAEGHFGNKSKNLVRHYAEDLGFEYMSAENEQEYLLYVDRFVTPENLDRPILFEIFTTTQDENDALYLMRHIERQPPQRQLSFPKPPIFCGTKDYTNAVAMVFGIQNYIALEDDTNNIPIEKIADLFNGNNFPVFFTDVFDQIKPLLEKNGLQEDRDFSDGRKILRGLF